MITQEELQRLFTYDPSEPLALRWNVRQGTSEIQIGDIAGCWRPMKWGSPVPVRSVNVGKIRLAVHRAVWIYIKGERPPKRLGFRNGDRGDCRIENLVENPKAVSVEQARKIRNEAPISLVYKDSEREDWTTVLRTKHFRKIYKITPAEYARMLESQGGVCAICKRPELMIRHGKAERLSIDHCHETGTIRGLLCTNCNNGIGRFGDSPAWLRAAADYLEIPRQPPITASQISLFDVDLLEAAD